MMAAKRRKKRIQGRDKKREGLYLRQPCIFNYRNEDQILLSNRHDSHPSLAPTGHLRTNETLQDRSAQPDSQQDAVGGGRGVLHEAEGAPSVTVSQDKRSCRACFRISHSEFHLAGGGWGNV